MTGALSATVEAASQSEVSTIIFFLILNFGADVIFLNPVMGRVLQERWLEAVAVPRQAHAGADGVQGQGGGC